MRLEVKGRNVEVNDAIRRYAAEKLDRIEKQLPETTQIEVELQVEKNPSIADHHIAEATVWTKGSTIRARERSVGMEASIDQLVDKLERQVKRYREKRRVAPRRHARDGGDPPEPAPLLLPDEEQEASIVKMKQFSVYPMTPEEAVLQLELVGHDFFVFRNAKTEIINVVYRRRDGDYGLIEPS
jgi:ribosome hibernation promoting factor